MPTIAKRPIVTDRRGRSDRRAFPHESWQRVLIGIRGPEFRQVRRGRSREAVVGEDCSGADHDAILNRDCVADVNHRVDLHPVADLDAVRDVGLLADDALLADPRVVPNVDVVPDGRAFTDRDVVFDEGCRVDSSGHM
jgi:hypothetical protein